MAIQFDPVNKHIKITSGTSISALALYNAVMDWCDEKENMGYSVPMKAVGKFPMGGGINSDSIFLLINGWKIKLYDGTYQFTITGTLITDDESARTVPPDSGNVEVVFQVSSQGTVICPSIKQEDKEELRDMIHEKTGGELGSQIDEVANQVGEVQEQTTNIEHISEGRWKIEGDYLIMYDKDNPNIIHKKFRLVKDAEGRIVERVPE